jgi:hypothetical protein
MAPVLAFDAADGFAAALEVCAGRESANTTASALMDASKR